MQPYKPLPTGTLAVHARFHRPTQTLPGRVGLDSPAIDVMTDLKKVAAVTIGPGAAVAEANESMIANKVRLLLVIDPENTIVGLITATDVLGEKPVLHMHHTHKQPAELTVADIMTPRGELDVIQMADVAAARVGNIVATLQREGRQHALVVDIDKATMIESVRGIFSSTQIARQLGRPVETADVAKSFAELEQAIVTS